jgi:putative ABC transport system ATP-binding protein
MTKVIDITNLTKDYHTPSGTIKVLRGINISIDEGDFVAIMGPSGSGKSTLMHILGALDIPTSGNYFLSGQDVSALSDDALAEIRNRNIGFVFQAFNLLSGLSVLENVCLPGIYGNLPETECQKRALKQIALVGLAERTHFLANQLSGGQQQRVAIARALTMRPKLILADEPTGNLPTSQTNEVLNYFTSLNKKGNTVVVITHEPDVAAFAKRILYLRDGVIIKEEKNLAKWKQAAKQSDILEKKLES